MIGGGLKAIRDEKKHTQADVAKVLGVSRTTYTQYETGKSEPDLATVDKPAQLFNVSVDWLLGRIYIRAPLETIAAHHDGEEWTEEELESIEQFKEFVRMKREQQNKK